MFTSTHIPSIAALGYVCLSCSNQGILKPADNIYLMGNPGRVITSEVIASLVGETWAQSVNLSVVLRRVGFLH